MIVSTRTGVRDRTADANFRRLAMRTWLAAGAMLAFLGVGAAQAAPLSIGAMTLAPQAQQQFAKDYGMREVRELSDYANVQLSRALTRAGAQITPDAPVRVEITLVAATPNKPTMKQLGDRVGLDYMRSIGVGGAELNARFVDVSSGRTLQEVGYRWYESSLANEYSLTTWGDAREAIRLFAREVAEAYAHSSALEGPAGS
jgi:hypothetical protein